MSIVEIYGNNKCRKYMYSLYYGTYDIIPGPVQVLQEAYAKKEFDIH